MIQEIWRLISGKSLSIILQVQQPGFARETKSCPWTIFYVNYIFFDIYQSSRVYCISRGYLTFHKKLPNIFKFCKDQSTHECLLYKIRKDFENIFKNEIKRLYEYNRSPSYLLYLAWKSDFSSKSKKDILVLLSLKFF